MTDLALAPRVVAAERLRSRAWIAYWWAGSRAVVLVAALAARNHPFRLLGSWDGRWYRIVAQHGYLLEPGRQSDPAFFPLYPLLLRAGHAVGLGYLAAGLLISNLAFLGALVAFEALTRDLFGAVFARRATIYVAIFPVGFVFSMVYPESLVLCALALTVLCARRGRWLAAAIVAALGTLARPEMMFVALPLLPLALRARSGVALGAVLAPFAALGSFALYLGLQLHDPLAWTHAERAWGRQFTPIGLLTAIEHLPKAFDGNAWVVRDVVLFLVYLALLVAARKAFVPRAWLAAGAIVVVLPTFSGSFNSIGRFGLLAPALFWGLAALGRSPRGDAAIRAACLALLVAATVTLPLIFP